MSNISDVERKIRAEILNRSLAPKRQEVKGRPKLAKIDKLHEKLALENYLKGLDNYVA